MFIIGQGPRWTFSSLMECLGSRFDAPSRARLWEGRPAADSVNSPILIYPLVRTSSNFGASTNQAFCCVPDWWGGSYEGTWMWNDVQLEDWTFLFGQTVWTVCPEVLVALVGAQ